MNNTPTYSIEELSALTGISRRTIRFYVQQELIRRPNGSRRGSWYDQQHLTQLLEIKRWQEAGLNLDRIRQLLRHAEDGSLIPPTPRQPGHIAVWSRIDLADGVELNLNPAVAGLTPEQVSDLTSTLIRLFQDIKDGTQPE